MGDARIGVLICYEGMYPALARAYRRAGANALVVMTNDAWWGKSLFAPWHARMIASRAREVDVPVVRAANTGVSSATNRLGHFVEGSDMDRKLALELPLAPTRTGPTVYASSGEAFVILMFVGIVAAFLNARLRALRARTPDESIVPSGEPALPRPLASRPDDSGRRASARAPRGRLIGKRRGRSR